MKEKLKTLPKCDMAVSQNEEIKAQLKNAQRVALDDTASALQSITELEQLASKTKQPNTGNIRNAKEALGDAMVQLGIVASNGEGFAKVKEILSNYGLEDLF